MKKILFVLPIAISSFSFAQNNTPQFTDDQKASYYIGMNIANNLKKEGINVDSNLLLQGMNDALTGKKGVLPAEEMNTFMMGFSQKMQEKKIAAQKVIAAENKKKEIEFLAKNKLVNTVKTTPSGLQYEILQEGDKKSFPKSTDLANVKYTGKLIDGTIFDSTDKSNGGNPMQLSLSNVIKGWTEGIQLMSKGAKYRFYIPSSLAYGEQGAGGVIPPNSPLIFDVELVDFTANASTPPANNTKTPAAPKKGK